jgi:GDPmannose 4,6-dehydratase
MKAVIFGVNGQDGFFLSKLLVSKGIEVIGVSRTNSKWILGNVADFNFVNDLIKKERAQYVFLLAANSTTKHEALFENNQTIIDGTINILESVYKYSPHSKVFVSGSGLQFENKSLPIKETDPFQANSAYSFARISSIYAARYYRSLGLKVYVGYFFNHDSPLRNERHVNQKIVQTLKRIANGGKENLELYDITVKKEFGYSKDIVEGVWTLINNEIIFEATIGTGIAHSISDWLDVCCANFDNLGWREFTMSQPNFKKEYDVLVSDPSTINKLGWKHKADIYTLAKIMINE